ncbi:discoidin domain-containing protein [Aquimarina sp. 2201CG1-2-11]|uniref:galactose-binding domain-containing protein n=1 Tax=Aquimarina discodermiae TaxID=3231043 RepID=UPI003461BF3D
MKKISLFYLILSCCFTTLCAQEIPRIQKIIANNGIQVLGWMGAGGVKFLTNTKTYTINKDVRYLRIQRSLNNGPLRLAEVQIFSGGVNVASLSQGATVVQSGGAGANGPELAIDGNTDRTDDTTITMTTNGDQAFWQIDLGSIKTVDSIKIYVKEGDRYHMSYILSSTVDMGMTDYNILRTLSTTNQHGTTVTQPGEEWDDLGWGVCFAEINNVDPQFLEKNNTPWSITNYATFFDSEGTKIGHRLREITSEEVQNGFLNASALNYYDRLYSVVLGDEIHYNTALNPITKEWVNASHNHYPDVLIGTSSLAFVNDDGTPKGGWTLAQLRTHVSETGVDILQWDHNFLTDTRRAFGPNYSLKLLFDQLYRFRKVALEGRDGTGANPLEFGQISQGYKKTEYVISQSQINARYYSNFVSGGKHIAMFRVFTGRPLFWYNEPIIFDYYKEVTDELLKLSPYLSRLTSTDLRYIPGKHLSGGVQVTNDKPNQMPLWDSTMDPFITQITATNLTASDTDVPTINDGLPGDLAVGYFKPVKNLSTDSEIAMAPIHNQNSVYFMIMNAFNKENGLGAEVGTQAYYDQLTEGAEDNCRQEITISIDFGSPDLVQELRRVNRQTGLEEVIPLTPLGGTQYEASFVLGGAEADLFYWEHYEHSYEPVKSANLALNKPTTQSKTGHSLGTSDKAVDGNTDGVFQNGSVTSTGNTVGVQDYWEVNLGKLATIDSIKVWNRADCCSGRLTNYHVFVSDTSFTSTTVAGSQAQSGVLDFHNTGDAGRPSTIFVNNTGQYVRVQIENSNEKFHLAEIEVFGKFIPENLAINKLATQSKTGHSLGTADKAVDGNTDGFFQNGSVTSTGNTTGVQDYWEVDLGNLATIDSIHVWNRIRCCSDRLANYHVFVSATPFTTTTVTGSQTQSRVLDFHNTGEAGVPSTIFVNSFGRYVRVQIENSNKKFNLAEIEVFGEFITSNKNSLNQKETFEASEKVETGFKIYYKASSGLVNISIDKEVSPSARIYIYDITGRIIQSKGATKGINEFKLPAGLFFAILNDKGNVTRLGHIVIR